MQYYPILYELYTHSNKQYKYTHTSDWKIHNFISTLWSLKNELIVYILRKYSKTLVLFGYCRHFIQREYFKFELSVLFSLLISNICNNANTQFFTEYHNILINYYLIKGNLKSFLLVVAKVFKKLVGKVTNWGILFV